MCASLSNSSIEASAIGKFESVPICTQSYKSVPTMVQPEIFARGFYPSAMDAIINPAKIFDSAIYHSLYTLRIGDIDMNDEVAVFRV